nr:hypothetical protein [Tanacetum cinerariifolium]
MIGSVVGIGDIVPVMSVAGKKILRTIVAEDVDGNHLDFTFGDTWASMWDQYVNKRSAIEHLVIILQLGKLKYWDGIPTIHKALFGTKIFINRNILEMVQELDGYDANQVKIELFSTEVKVVSIAEFFHGTINRMVSDISIPTVLFMQGFKESTMNMVGRTRLASNATKKFKAIVRVIDESGSAQLLFFNNNFVKLSGCTTWEIIKKYNMDQDEYWPEEELDHIIGKTCLFKLFYSQYNLTKNNHTYRCDSFFEDVELINHFKKNFIDTESDDETRKTASRIEVSTSKKRKLIIDQHEVKSEPEEEGNISKANELVAKKMEPED